MANIKVATTALPATRASIARRMASGSVGHAAMMWAKSEWQSKSDPDCDPCP